VDAVATDPAYWGCGVGSAVMARFAAETRGYQLCALSTTVPGFYDQLGWKRWRGPLAVHAPNGLVYTPDECVMILRTPSAPPLDLDELLTVEPRGGQPW
jgi:GNAT superfamily N-acetyltransferase